MTDTIAVGTYFFYDGSLFSMEFSTELGQPILVGTNRDVLLLQGFIPIPLPLQNVIPSYLYQEYSDDADLQALVASFNALAQSYLDWFNSTPLGVYTNPNISGPMLDWIMEGIYGITRPVFSSRTTKYIAGLNSGPLNSKSLNGKTYLQSGTATVATDDYYKRVGTWTLYTGNGRMFNASLLRLKVARFLFGLNGTDVSLDQAQSVHVQPQTLPLSAAPALSAITGGSIAARIYGVRTSYVTALGEGLAGAAAMLSVAASHVFVVGSPPPEPGATSYNVYANVLSTNPTHYRAGLNSGALNGAPLNGTNNRGVYPMRRQNASPIPIGTNWTEPTTGLIVGAPLPAVDNSNKLANYIITIPAGTASQLFKQAMEQNLLPWPFQLSSTVVIAA